jgi:hypothetical protein
MNFIIIGGHNMLLLEKILHAKKLNYQTLVPLIKPYVNPKYIDMNGTDTVNIFIDFWDIIKPLYNPQTIETLNTLKVDERFMVSSEIINIIAHYRHFFFSRMKMYTNIIFYYSDKKDNFRTSIFPQYKESFYDKRLNKKHQIFNILNGIIENNVNLIKLFCEYVPHVYFINTGTVEPSLIPYLFISDNSRLNQNIVDKNNVNIIISNEKIHYQDLLLQDKVLQFELRGKEKSRFVTSEDIINILLEKSKKEYNFSILPDMYSLILGLTGYSNYSIPSIKKMGNIKALNFIQNCIDNGILRNTEYNNLELLDVLEEILGSENLSKLKDNMLLLNNSMYKFNDKDLINIEMQLIDRIDAKSVRYVNDKYFTKYPILLDYVFEGEQYE